MWEQGDVLCQTNFSLLSSGLKIRAICSPVEHFVTTEVFHFEMLRLARFLYETIASSPAPH